MDVLKAELAGKLSGTDLSTLSERLEDVLTSNVFGALLYADATEILTRWLGMASNQLDKQLASRLPAVPFEPEFHFWPRMPSQKGTREPDLLLILRGATGVAEAAICVEAKFDAGVSDRNLDDDSPDCDERTGEQLPDQFRLLKNGKIQTRQGVELHLPAEHNRFHVFLTKHYARPAGVLDDYAKRIPAMATDLYWLNWNALPNILRKPRPSGRRGAELLLADLSDLLKRKGLDLAPFEGWHGMPSGPHRHKMSWFDSYVGLVANDYRFWFADLPPAPRLTTCSQWMEDLDGQ